MEVHLQILNVTSVRPPVCNRHNHLVKKNNNKALCHRSHMLFTLFPPKSSRRHFAHRLLFVPCCIMGNLLPSTNYCHGIELKYNCVAFVWENIFLHQPERCYCVFIKSPADGPLNFISIFRNKQTKSLCALKPGVPKVWCFEFFALRCCFFFVSHFQNLRTKKQEGARHAETGDVLSTCELHRTVLSSRGTRVLNVSWAAAHEGWLVETPLTLKLI